jgi:endonuclease/exonuclease/phosphatase family metal-dependent hydrolase
LQKVSGFDISRLKPYHAVMRSRSYPAVCGAWLLAFGLALFPAGAETFRVATYNVETYLDTPTQTRPVKSPAARAQVQRNLLALKPDVVALQEMGGTSALRELQDSLKAAGLDLPYWEHVAGFDTNIHVAILSRFPFTARRPHTNDDFLLGGRRFRVSRGFGEVDVRVNAHFSFTLLTAHLKSRRVTAPADEAELRLEEARIFRGIIDARLSADPSLNLVVLGDFNDTQDSISTRMILGHGRSRLIDTRPAESNDDNALGDGPSGDSRRITWTHYFSKNDTFSRIDYILLSPAMARCWIANETRVLRIANWGAASDHRPLVATFEADGE